MEEKEYSKSVKQNINAILNSRFTELVSCMEDCESPIEQIMALALDETLGSAWVVHREIRLGVEIIGIRKQEPIKVQSENTYIPDFSIPVWDISKHSGKMFAIECDGHEFHEKTKEQVTHDKARERELTASGYTVIRFSGSEIYNDPFKCASEVFEIIFSYFHDKRNAKAEG